MEIPLIISVDDHVVEPPTLWSSRLAAADRERGPHTVRRFGTVSYVGGRARFDEGEGEVAGWSDVWLYEDLAWPLHAGLALGSQRERLELDSVTYDDIDPGCWQQGPRLDLLTENHTEASICFPTVTRFCGQMFLEAKDKDFALTCLQAFNDWMIEEWCGQAARGRLIPLTLVPLWDVQLAAREVERCAARGSHAITFSEGPQALGLPSMYSGYWDPLWETCQATETVVNLHVGSSSKLPTTADDANILVAPTLLWQNSMMAMTDWLLSGTLARFPTLKVALSEGQVGWVPFVLERIDISWSLRRNDPDVRKLLPDRPSSYLGDRWFGCIFDDLTGLQLRDEVGMGQICVETDYPHVDSTYPHSRDTIDRLATDAGMNDGEIRQFVRGNAVRCFGLERFGLSA